MDNTTNESPIPENAYLVINAQIFPLRKLTTKVGRKFDNDLVLQDPSISRYHAEITYEEGSFVLHDLKSTSGTFLNSRPISKSILYSGDIISFAKMPTMFMNETEALSSRSKLSTGKLDS